MHIKFYEATSHDLTKTESLIFSINAPHTVIIPRIGEKVYLKKTQITYTVVDVVHFYEDDTVLVTIKI